MFAFNIKENKTRQVTGPLAQVSATSSVTDADYVFQWNGK